MNVLTSRMEPARRICASAVLVNEFGREEINHPIVQSESLWVININAPL
jgi:hypothetical protein